MFESSGGELSPASFKHFSQPFLAYIAKNLPIKLKELGLEQVPMIVFPKGQWYALDAACDMGYNVVGLDWLHDPAESVKTVGERSIVIQGNADPGVLYGSHASITEAVKAMVEGFGWADRRKGWIVNLGHGESFPFPLRYVLCSKQVLSRHHSICQPGGSKILLRGSSSSHQNLDIVLLIQQ